jgi:electron transport complex protein RnfC
MTNSTHPALEPEWGIKFPRPAASGPGLALVEAPVPELLNIPLKQHIGTIAKPLVDIGASVDKGEPIAATVEHHLGARLHAPTSGIITGLIDVSLAGNREAKALVLAADGEDRPWQGYSSVARPLDLTPMALRTAIIEAGIVGLGGAMFPAGIKLNPGSGINTLILNGVECEPQINCDDALMRRQPLEILQGAQIMLRILDADECIIAIKAGLDSTSPSHAFASISAALTALDDDRIRVASVPAIYPMGGEAQLIQRLTGREIPSGGLPWDTGVACQNVGTAAAITHFFSQGEPLLKRIVTVTGRGVKQPVNVIARLGTPVAKIIECAGGYSETATRLIFGGPMMGVAAATDAVPVTKATNCVYVASRDELGMNLTEMPCIRCGDCAQVCPANLSPQLLLQTQRSKDNEGLENLGLMDCIECGCCDYVCPSQIPLTRGFHDGKREIWTQRAANRQAERAEQRFNNRAARIKAETEERATALATQLADLSDRSPDQALAELKNRVAHASPEQRPNSKTDDNS